MRRQLTSRVPLYILLSTELTVNVVVIQKRHQIKLRTKSKGCFALSSYVF